MCGICGMFNYSGGSIDDSVLRKMNLSIAHRGPDGEGYFSSGSFGFAMRRLSIIDKQRGTQPVKNEDGKLYCIFNGEIYNYKYLRQELIKDGHIFKTDSDTEIIVHLYEKYGDEFVKYIHGMFAIALWDCQKERLLLVRDRVGVKPLFYTVNAGVFSFCSELQGLVNAGLTGGDMDFGAVDSFLSLQYIHGPLTIFKNVYKVPPASVMTVEKYGCPVIRKYWDLPAEEQKYGEDIPLETLRRELYETLTQSVRMRLNAEVPVGVFLSGGLDSSVVTALVSREVPSKVKTFSVAFKESDFNELKYARMVSKMYSTDHTAFFLDVGDITADDLLDLAGRYGEPFADAGALPFYFLSKNSKESIGVALTGDGGDESFAGYMRYAAVKADGIAAGFLPPGLKRLLLTLVEKMPKNAPYGLAWRAGEFLKLSLKKDLTDKYLNSVSYFNSDELSHLYSPLFKSILGEKRGEARAFMSDLFSGTDALELTDRMIYADVHSYLPDDLMMKNDIASMASALETRSPFLSHAAAFLLLIKGASGKPSSLYV